MVLNSTVLWIIIDNFTSKISVIDHFNPQIPNILTFNGFLCQPILKTLFIPWFYGFLNKSTRH